MDRGTYPKRWGVGPRALRKQTLIKEGKLDKHGKPNDQTPEDWVVYYVNQTQNNFLKKPEVQEAAEEVEEEEQ